jgi:hypothetical protein
MRVQNMAKPCPTQADFLRVLCALSASISSITENAEDAETTCSRWDYRVCRLKKLMTLASASVGN